MTVVRPVGIGTQRSPDLYASSTKPWRYGADDTTYVRAGAYLSGPGLVEDWGCGTTYASRFIGAPYIGIDGIPSRWTGMKVDLSTYRSSVPKILMRHVLEHNWDWAKILVNMCESFTDRACLILFIRPGPELRNVQGPDLSDEAVWPGLQLPEDLIHTAFEFAGVNYYYEDLETDTPPFNYERIYFLEKVKVKP